MHGYKATDIAWEAPVKSSSERLILLAIAKFADEKCESFPSFEAISRATKLNRKTVIAGIKALGSSGYLIVQKSGHTANAYKLIPISDPESSETGTPKNGCTENGSTKFGSTEIGSTKNG